MRPGITSSAPPVAVLAPHAASADSAFVAGAPLPNAAKADDIKKATKLLNAAKHPEKHLAAREEENGFTILHAAALNGAIEVR